MTNWIFDGECYLNDEGNLVTIRQDYGCESPREYECNMGTFYTWMNHYGSPDSNDFYGFDDLGMEYGIRCEDNPGQFITKFNEKAGVCLPVYAIVHSGVAYSASWSNPFHDPWDSGFVGVIFATKERIRELRCIKRVTKKIRREIIDELMSEVNLYNEWANGNCYGFITYDLYGDEVDSCWGFIGTDPNENGLAEACGGLHDCEFNSVDEFVEYHEEMRLAQEVNEIAENVLEGLAADNERYIA